MHYRIFLLFAIVMLLPQAYAVVENMDINVAINIDRTTQWSVLLNYSDYTMHSDYFIFSDITDVSVFADGKRIDCKIQKEQFGTSIICNNIYAKSIVYNFKAYDLVRNLKDLLMFNYRFSINQLTNNVRIRVTLPLGAALIKEEEIIKTGFHRFEPVWGIEGTDGRNIYIEWRVEKPELADSYNVYVVYEEMFPLFAFLFLVPIPIIIIIAIIIIFYFYHKKHSVKNILPVLTDDERKIMEILLREKKPIDQRQIVKEMDYSKAKVSRLIQNLVDRGLIEKIIKGRKNIIKLKKK